MRDARRKGPPIAQQAWSRAESLGKGEGKVEAKKALLLSWLKDPSWHTMEIEETTRRQSGREQGDNGVWISRARLQILVGLQESRQMIENNELEQMPHPSRVGEVLYKYVEEYDRGFQRCTNESRASGSKEVSNDEYTDVRSAFLCNAGMMDEAKKSSIEQKRAKPLEDKVSTTSKKAAPTAEEVRFGMVKKASRDAASMQIELQRASRKIEGNELEGPRRERMKQVGSALSETTGSLGEGQELSQEEHKKLLEKHQALMKEAKGLVKVAKQR